MEQRNVQCAVDGLEVVEGWLSTITDLTKLGNSNFAPPPLGGRVAVKRQLNGRKVCVGGWVGVYIDVMHVDLASTLCCYSGSFFTKPVSIMSRK